jgi:hypothetical protein
LKHEVESQAAVEAEAAVVAAPLVPLADVRIYCPDCDYVLTGLTENRCPECGREFDAERLRRWAGQPGLALTFSPRESGRERLLPFFLSAFFSPSRLARRIPPNVDYGEAGGYAMGIRLLAGLVVPIVLLVLLAILTGSDGPVKFMGFLVLPLMLASFLCELAMAGLLARLAEPLAVPRDARFAFWRTLCRCFAVFLLANVTLILLAVLLVGTADVVGVHLFFIPWLPVIFYAIPLVMFVWWSAALGRAVRARGLEGAGRTAAILLIPFVGLASVFLGVLITFGEAWVFLRH